MGEPEARRALACMTRTRTRSEERCGMSVFSDLRRGFGSELPSAEKANVFVVARLSDENLVRAFRERFAVRVTWTAVRQGKIDGKSSAGLTAWQADASEKIRNANVVCVLVGEGAAASDSIAWELELAKALGKPTVAWRGNQQHLWPASLPPTAIREDECSLTDLAERFDALALKAGLGASTNTSDQSMVLDLYRLVLETTERLEDRRQNLHAFFLSVNTLLLGAVGVVGKQGLGKSDRGLLLIVPAIALLGVFLCQTWRRQVQSYGQVRRSKFAILEALERGLPAAPFVAEWISLRQRDYESFTESESRVPVGFLMAYVVAAVVALAGFVLAVVL